MPSLADAMVSAMPAFLSARWEHLILASFPVPARLLAPRLAPGLELDLFEGSPYVSLVGFMFLGTRVLGVPWPGYRDFPEINLRFYVRRGDERGVMFVREFVPLKLVAQVARLLYNEPYAAAPMSGAVSREPDALRVTYGLELAGRRHTLTCEADPTCATPGPESAEAWFKEHSWGYGRDRAGRLLRYEVRHPAWAVYPVRWVTIDLDWAAVYGPEWAWLAGRTPASVVLAAGSDVTVHPYGRL